MIVYREHRHNKICYIEVVFYAPTQAGTPLYGCSPLRGQVDLAGIEPASESLSIQASPITVILLTFPPSGAG